MVSIILAASPETKAEAIAAGFREATVLLRHNPVTSTEENKRKLESELFILRPAQFLVSDYWGVGAD